MSEIIPPIPVPVPSLVPSPVRGAPTWDIDPYSRDVLLNLEAWYDGLRERGPIVWLSHYGCWAIGHFEVVREVFADWQRFGSARGVGLADFAREQPWRPPSILLEVDPPDHDRTRKVMMRTMTPRALAGLEAPMRREAEALVERLLQRDTFDAVKDLAEAYPLKVFPDAVGLNADDREKLLIYGAMVFNAIGPDNEVRRESLANAAAVVPWITAKCARDALIETDLPGSGLGELIYQAVDDDEITEAEAGLLVRSLLSAGIDTTVASLGAALKYFSENPSEWDIVRDDPTQVRKAIEEVLRLSSPVHAFFRTASVDTEVSGITVSEGDKIMCVLGAANTDPEKWPDAARFDVTRKAAGHIAFGTGIHVCVGMAVARLEMDAMLTALAERVERIEALEVATWRPGNSLRTLDHGRMRLIAKK
jgi:cytochrome P450